MNYAEVLVGSKLPLRPRKWLFREGWTKYDSVIKKCYPVDFPDENALVFDVETQVAEGGFPKIATAVSKNAWLVFLGCFVKLCFGFYFIYSLHNYYISSYSSYLDAPYPFVSLSLSLSLSSLYFVLT